jgi:hypothetical protein
MAIRSKFENNEWSHCGEADILFQNVYVIAVLEFKVMEIWSGIIGI